MLFYLFVIVLIVSCIIFLQIVRRKEQFDYHSQLQSIHHNYHQSQKDVSKKEKQDSHIVFRFFERLWAFLTKAFQQVDSIIDRFLLKYTASNISVRILLNHIDSVLKISNCKYSPTSSNSSSPASSGASSSQYNENEILQKEIQKLTETLYLNYIHFWHEKIGFQNQRTEFKELILRNLRLIIGNFYNRCKTNINLEEILVKFTFFLKIDSLKQNNCDKVNEEVDEDLRWITTESQVNFLLNCFDRIVPIIVPAEVKDLILDCNCCKTDDEDNQSYLNRCCLERSDNCVRLFVYNLLIHSLFLPFIDRFTNPHYLLYKIIQIISMLDDELSFNDIFNHLKIDPNISFEDEVIGDAIQKFEQESVIDSALVADTDLAEEALEDVSKNSIFSNIKIVDVKITNSSRQRSQFVDYIVVFNVLECDNSSSTMTLFSEPDVDFDRKRLVTKTYQIKRRFREFLELQHKLEKCEKLKETFTRIKNKPSNIQLSSETILDRFRLKRITEESSIVQLRKQYLEEFLTNLANCPCLSESSLFCDFLGYNFARIRSIQAIIHSEERNNDNINRLNSNNSVERGIDKFKDFIKFFLPLQAKVGHLTTQVDDVVVNESVSQKYSITKIDLLPNLNEELLLKIKLDNWFEKNNVPDVGQSFDDFLLKTNNSLNINFKNILNHFLCTIFQKKSSTILYYFSCKLNLILDIIQIIYKRVLSFDRIVIYWLHLWHKNLTDKNNINITSANDSKKNIVEHSNNNIMTFDEFYYLTQSLTFEELYDRFCDHYRRILADRTAKSYRLSASLNLLSFLNSSTMVLNNFSNLLSSHKQNKYSFYLLLDLFVKQFTE